MWIPQSDQDPGQAGAGHYLTPRRCHQTWYVYLGLTWELESVLSSI